MRRGESLAVCVALALVLAACAPVPPSPPDAATPAPSSVPTNEPDFAHALPFDSIPAGSAGAPISSEVTEAAKEFVERNSAGVVAADVVDVKSTQDSEGRWWFSALAVPSDGTVDDAATIYMYKQNRVWMLIELGTGVSTEVLPPDVRCRL